MRERSIGSEDLTLFNTLLWAAGSLQLPHASAYLGLHLQFMWEKYFSGLGVHYLTNWGKPMNVHTGVPSGCPLGLLQVRKTVQGECWSFFPAHAISKLDITHKKLERTCNSSVTGTNQKCWRLNRKQWRPWTHPVFCIMDELSLIECLSIFVLFTTV